MAKLFKGYLLASNKVPLSSVKDSANWLEHPPENHDYVGILHEDYIQVDFDDEESSKIALRIAREQKLKCDILKTTRGIHLYFKKDDVVKNCSVGLYNAMGLTSDIGLGDKNRVIPLRTTKTEMTKTFINGEEVETPVTTTTVRPWIQTYDELDILPPYFRPLGKKNYGLKNTATRNDTLYTYILVLQSYAFSKEEVRKTIRVINKYMLETPLTDREIDTITRDDAFSEELFYGEKGKFLHDRFGNYMLTNSNIAMIDGQVHIYTNDQIYSNNPDEFERQMLKKIPALKDAQRKEVYKYIQLQCNKKVEFSSPKYLGLRNQILDIQTMEEFPYTPNFVINNKIDYNYNPNAYNETMDKTLNKVCCNDKHVRSLLEEMIGYSLYRANIMQVCFILTGEGSNGKSTILNCIKKLLGKQNYTSLDMKELEENFKPAELYGKLANIGDDISAKFMETTSVFKKCVTGETFIAAKKYGQPFSLESYATQIFCANELPNVRDKSDGFARRIVLVPFNAKFSKTDHDYDPFIEDKLLSDDAMEYLLKIAIEGLKRVLYNKSFTSSERGEREKDEYMKVNNNVLEYFDDVEPELENNAINDCYLAYNVWCVRNACTPVKKSNFTKEVKKKYGLNSKVKSIDGKSIRIYEREV